MSGGRGFSKFVSTFDREEVKADPAHAVFKANHQETDGERKRYLKAVAKQMRDEPGYAGAFDKMGLSDSEDEVLEVPSLENLLADLDAPEAERNKGYGKAIYSNPQHDAVRSFLGEALDAPAAPAPSAAEASKPPRSQVVAAKTGGATGSQDRGEKSQPKVAGRASWQDRMAEAEQRREEEQLRLEEERRQEQQKLLDLRKQGWALLDTDKFVQSTALTARGASSLSCNTTYTYAGNHKGRPLFQSESGAIIYFNEFWKMNSSYKVTTWLYAVTSATGQSPPQGLWRSERSQGPMVTEESPVLRVMAEKGIQIMLEDGDILQKNMENKTWCWSRSLEQQDTEERHILENDKENFGHDTKSSIKEDVENRVSDHRPNMDVD